MLVKTSVVCLFMVLYMIGFYYRKPHIPVKSTIIFQILTGVAFLNTLFYLITIYTVNHRDTIPDKVNLVAHIIYLMTILGFVYLLFLYMRSFLETNLKFSRALKVCQRNDTIGHSGGDELLQSFARLLTDAVGDAGKVYRQGGDEFAVLYSGDAGQLLHRLEEQCAAHNQVCNIPVSYAIGYCELCDKDFLNVADRMMYADKKRKKLKKKNI